MPTYEHRRRMGLTAVSMALLLLIGCAAEPPAESSTTPNQGSTTVEEAADSGDSQPSSEGATDDTAGDEPRGESTETTIPAGAYAANDEFAFPVPEGWEILDPFVEDKLGKDVSVVASVEYPGDAKEAAATYQALLQQAGFDTYTYAPGELTNQASLAAEGAINGIAYTTILNFDVHADGLQRVSITAVEDD